MRNPGRRKKGALRNVVSRKALASGQGRGRTADTGIFSPVLYQLSYLTGAMTAQSQIVSSAVRVVNSVDRRMKDLSRPLE